jgi:NAD(P)-dependent dehydrogenase (short-subunit alcohol dehydrogenase family)
MSGLSGRVAVVTGAASGIGRAVAERLTSEGAAVVAVDLARDEPPGASLAVVCDVADAAQVDALARRVLGELGRWDVLVNAAGIVVHGAAGECSEDDWDRVFAVNARGTWLLCRASLPPMVAQGAGAIVNISSGIGLRPVAGLTAYAASKAAVISLTRSIAIEYGRQGVRANCICPGRIDTPMHRLDVQRRGLAGGEEEARMLASYAITRVGRPEEVAATAVFLAGEDGAYITGATLAVDGGRTLH